MPKTKKKYLELAEKRDEYLITLDNSERDKHYSQTRQDNARTELAKFMLWIEKNWET